MLEETYIQTDDQYSQGIVLDEYNGKLSLCSANEGKDGKIYLQWAFLQNKDKQPRPKAIPWKITLGDISQAVHILETYLAVVNKMIDDIPDRKVQSAEPVIGDDSIPF
jgi:hypothetical protein